MLFVPLPQGPAGPRRRTEQKPQVKGFYSGSREKDRFAARVAVFGIGEGAAIRERDSGHFNSASCVLFSFSAGCFKFSPGEAGLLEKAYYGGFE